MLTDCHPFDPIPHEWFRAYHFLYPSLRENGLHARKLEAEKRLLKYLENVPEDGRQGKPEAQMAQPLSHNQPFLSQEIRERILPELYRSGMGTVALAKKFHVSRELIRRLLHRLHEPIRKRGPRLGSKQTPEQIAKRWHPGKRKERVA